MKKTLLILLLSGASALAQCPVARIAVSADGNMHDADDICASPMIVAMIGKTGNQAKLVHYDYANHYWQSTAASEEAMRTSVVDTASQWGGFSPVFFNATQQRDAAVAHLAAEINKSTADDPLVILGLGPQQTVGMAVAQSDKTRRGYVTLMSHSTWNDNHATKYGASEGLPSPLYSYTKIGTMGVKVLHMIDQNPGTNRPYSEYYWLRDSADPKLRWLWDRGVAAGKSTFDCSDAGVMYCYLTGDPTADPLKLKAFFSTP